jgi:hypothetical protein
MRAFNTEDERMSRTLAATAVVCALLVQPPLAEAAEQPLWGYGVRSCASYLDADADREAGDAAEFQRYEDWLTGFISGLNLATGEDVLHGSSIESAMRRTQAFCKGNPDADFFNASMEFVRMLSSIK